MSPDARRALTTVTSQPSPALSLARALRRAGVRFALRFAPPPPDAHPANPQFVVQPLGLVHASQKDRERLRAMKSDMRQLLLWEHQEATLYGVRPCPDCGAVDWVPRYRPYDVQRPGGLLSQAREDLKDIEPLLCPDCKTDLWRSHPTWRHCARCGYPGKAPRPYATIYLCGTCHPELEEKRGGGRHNGAHVERDEKSNDGG